MDKNRDKELLEAEIKRLEAHSMIVIFDDFVPEGLEIKDESDEINYFSTELDITATLANWRQLPDGAGSLEAWRKLVDIDWSTALNQNSGID